MCSSLPVPTVPGCGYPGIPVVYRYSGYVHCYTRSTCCQALYPPPDPGSAPRAHDHQGISRDLNLSKVRANPPAESQSIARLYPKQAENTFDRRCTRAHQEKESSDAQRCTVYIAVSTGISRRHDVDVQCMVTSRSIMTERMRLPSAAGRRCDRTSDRCSMAQRRQVQCARHHRAPARSSTRAFRDLRSIAVLISPYRAVSRRRCIQRSLEV